jgi:3-hydroxyacyl-[acyl-carrier-protein] dehydratase
VSTLADRPGAATRAPGLVLSADEIARLLPHRYPFAMLDRVTALVPGVSGEAIKNVSAADVVLSGHFPGRMIYPGVLLVECVAQLAAVVYGTAAVQRAGGELVDDVAHRVGYLAEIKQAKFLRPVVPGDQLVVRAQSGPRLGALISVTGQASVAQEVVMTVRLTVTERDETDPSS